MAAASAHVCVVNLSRTPHLLHNFNPLNRRSLSYFLLLLLRWALFWAVIFGLGVAVGRYCIQS